MQDKKNKILIIDDEETIVQLLTTVLSLYGYQSISCRQPEKAVEIAVKEQPNLILLDIAMPDIDGYQICQELKKTEKTASIPVIMITALALNQDKVKGFESGANGFIFKPFEPALVIAEIAKLVKSI